MESCSLVEEAASRFCMDKFQLVLCPRPFLEAAETASLRLEVLSGGAFGACLDHRQ